MFALSYEVIINGLKFNGVNAVTIERLVTSLTSTANITLPTTAVQKKTDGSSTNVLTSQAIKKGDEVEIKLGYNGNLKTEFKGFVSRLNYKSPLVIECEDYIYKLKGLNIAKTYKNTTLNILLTDLLEDTGLFFNTGDISINIKNIILATESGDSVPREEALREILQRYGLVGYFDTEGVLFVGLRQGQTTGESALKLGWNTISDDSLKYFKADEQKYKIKAIYFQPDGTRKEFTAGDSDGSQRTIFLSDVSSEAEIQVLAENELKKYKYDGYSGEINCFLQPFIEPANIINLTDPTHDERNGAYYCDGVKVSFTTSGARRVVILGAKV